MKDKLTEEKMGELCELLIEYHKLKVKAKELGIHDYFEHSQCIGDYTERCEPIYRDKVCDLCKEITNER